MKKLPKSTKSESNVKLWEDYKKKFDFGNGTTLVLTTKKKDDKKSTVDLFFSNKTPKLEINGRKIEVEYTSTEQEDQDLLHFLAGKV